MDLQSLRKTLFPHLCLTAVKGSETRFEHHFGDSNLSGSIWGQTALADLDGDELFDVVIAAGENRNARIGWSEAPSDPKNGRWITHLLPKVASSAGMPEPRHTKVL